jgi:hypothetical protein
MGALENLLPEKLKQTAKYLGNGEFVLPYLEALTAVEIANVHEIAILGVDSHEVRAEGILTVGLSDGSRSTKYESDWTAYVRRLNAEARDWIIAHPLGDNHGYILTSASKQEFDALGG